MLTEKERRTLAGYEVLAAAHNERHSDNVYLDEYQAFCVICPYGTVVDLGCGGGRDALLIWAHQYIGVDASLPMLTEAQRLAPGSEFICADLYRLPFPDASVNGVWAAASLLHVPRERMPEALAEIRRVLVLGGTFFCVLRKGEGEHLLSGRMPGADRYFWFWEPDEWIGAMRTAGFVCETWHERTLHTYPWICTFAIKP